MIEVITPATETNKTVTLKSLVQFLYLLLRYGKVSSTHLLGGKISQQKQLYTIKKKIACLCPAQSRDGRKDKRTWSISRDLWVLVLVTGIQGRLVGMRFYCTLMGQGLAPEPAPASAWQQLACNGVARWAATQMWGWGHWVGAASCVAQTPPGSAASQGWALGVGVGRRGRWWHGWISKKWPDMSISPAETKRTYGCKEQGPSVWSTGFLAVYNKGLAQCRLPMAHQGLGQLGCHSRKRGSYQVVWTFSNQPFV